MKKLLIPFLFFAVPAFGQFEAGVNGSAVYSKLHNVSMFFGTEDYTACQSFIITPQFSVKALYASKHYQFGITAGYDNRIYKARFDGVTPGGYTEYFHYYEPELPIAFFANRVAHLRRYDIYAGLFAGYLHCNANITTSDDFGGGETEKQYEGRFYYGAQAGVTYMLTRHIGINTELQAACYNYTAGSPANGSVLSFPLSVGIRYKFTPMNSGSKTK